MFLPKRDPFDVGIKIECRRSQKTDQGLAAFPREIHRERRRRRDRRDNWYSSGERFLDDLERRATADGQDVAVERQESIEQGSSDRLVDGVVASDIFPHDDRFSTEIE